MKIRKATVKDLEELVRVNIEFRKELVLYMPEEFSKRFRKELKPISEISKAVKLMITNRKGLLLVAEDKNQIVSFSYSVIYKDHNPVYKNNVIGKMDNIWVAKDYRGSGLSTKMKNQLFKWFKVKKCKWLEISVLSKNPAKKIYKKWGFDTFIDTMIKT